MNNGYQNFNGCRADKEGRKIFNTFFYSKLNKNVTYKTRSIEALKKEFKK
jgi:hypothetical protein